MQKITNDMDSSTDSDVAGNMSKNVNREFWDIDKDNIDNDNDFGSGMEYFELKGKEIACKLDMSSNKDAFENNVFYNSNAINPSDGESQTNNNNHTETAIVEGSGSVNSSSTKAPIKEPPR